MLAIIQLPVQITRGDAITAAIRVDGEVLNLLAQNGAVVVLPFVVSWLLSKTPVLRRTV